MMKLFKKTDSILILLIIVSALTKLMLLGEGMFSNPDEWRYKHSLNACNKLFEGNVTDCIVSIFSTDARPGEVIIKMIPASVQILVSKIFNLNILEPLAFLPVYIFNYIILIIISILHYKFSFLLSKNRLISLFSVLLFSLFVNSFVYLRHTFPYDISLLLGYYTVYNICKYEINSYYSKKRLISIGLIAFFSYLIYPGYLPVFFISLGILIFHKFNITPLKNIVNKVFYFGLGASILLFITELLSRSVSKSYLINSLVLSDTIKQGNFDETLLFPVKYLLSVEGITGIALIILLSLTIYYSLKNINKIDNVFSIYNIIIYGCLFFVLIHGIAGVFFYKVVFYGRLFHQYLPFLVLISSSMLIRYLRYKWIDALLIMVSMVLFIQYIIQINLILNVGYPRDYSWKLIKQNGYKSIDQYYGLNFAHTAVPKLSEELNPIGTFCEIDTINSNFVENSLKTKLLVNACFVLPSVSGSYYYLPHDVKNNKYNYIEDSVNHYVNLPAYQFEGYKKDERDFLTTCRLKMYLIGTSSKSSRLD